MAAPPKTFIGPCSQRCLVYDGELYIAAKTTDMSACSTKASKRKTPATANDQSVLQKLQRVADVVDGSLTRVLVKHREMESAMVWDQSLQLAANVCSFRPGLFMRAVGRCYTESGVRREEARLLDEVASAFIEGIVVHGSPLGSLPPLDAWPAPCIITWEVDGSEYSPPQANQGLSCYLDDVNNELNRMEQLSAWMRFLKPLLPRFVWLPIKELLLRQRRAMDALSEGEAAEHRAEQEMANARREVNQRRSLLGNYEDHTLHRLEEAFRDASRAYEDLQQRNSGLLDWYRTASFVLTGHTAAARPLRRDEYPTLRTLDSSVFGVDCLEALTASTEPFFVEFDGCFAPAWGLFWDWVLTGALKKWLPAADSLDASLSLLREREIRLVRQQWENTPEADRGELLRSWLSGPGAIFPARVADMVGTATLPPVSEEAPIYKQLRAMNPWRGDCDFEPHDEALFGLPNKSACHLCGLEEVDRVSSLYTSCPHAACSVCYTITHKDTFRDAGCPVRCGGTGTVHPERPRLVPSQRFVETSLAGS